MFMENDMATAATIYTDTPIRHTQKYKDPRGYAEFGSMLAEHSAKGHALTMAMLQAKRPTLWDMEADLKKFSVPLLIIVGDEDETCLDGSLFLKRHCAHGGLTSHSAFRSHHHQQGTGCGQRRTRGAFCSVRERPLARAQAGLIAGVDQRGFAERKS
jgi:hypothetical protein